MLKRLRLKFICINMAFVVVMLCVIFGIVLRSTVGNLKEQNIQMLQAVDNDREKPGRPNDREPIRTLYFSLEKTPEGEIKAEGSEFFQLTDEELLRELWETAEGSEEPSGVIWEYELRFLKANSPHGQKLLFADISANLDTVQNLLWTCVLVGMIALVAFWLISLFLARWAVKPVEKAWAQQKQFVADASHELKTPLTVITTNAELLQESCSKEQAAQYTENILAMSRQMRGLTEGLLDLARLDNGTAPQSFTALDLSGLVEMAALPFEAVFFERELELQAHIEAGISVRGNEQKLRQVADILLDNAQKYAQSNSRVLLELKRSGHGQCLLSVQTRGETLSKEQLSHIFDRFYRCDEARAMNHSYGMGLSIAQSIIREHRGKIWAQSKEGVNTFYVQLPTV